MKTSIAQEESRTLLARALAVIPNLTYSGVGILNEPQTRRGEANEIGKQKTAEVRKTLSHHLDEIAICAEWIKQVAPTKTVRYHNESYEYKHLVEQWCRDRGSNDYVSNGSFIAAAVGLGFQGSYPKSVISVRRAAAAGHNSDRWLR